jgi:phosphate starvation-inducible protein PhoH
LHSGIIEISPLAYMRGRTFKRCFIIADEMQNSTPNQMLMLSTRIGDKTKLVVTGDLKQSDRSQSNGLIDFMNKYKLYNENNENNENDNKKMIQIVEMKHEDIRRSKVVSKIIDIYNIKPNSWVNNRLNINSEQVIEESVVQENVVGEKSFSKTINNLNITKYHYDNNNDCAIIPLSHML